MDSPDLLGPGEVGDGPRHAEHAMIAARAEMQLLCRAAQQAGEPIVGGRREQPRVLEHDGDVGKLLKALDDLGIAQGDRLGEDAQRELRLVTAGLVVGDRQVEQQLGALVAGNGLGADGLGSAVPVPELPLLLPLRP